MILDRLNAVELLVKLFALYIKNMENRSLYPTLLGYSGAVQCVPINPD